MSSPYESVIASLYESCLEPERLPEALAPLARYFESTGAAYWRVNPGGAGAAYFHTFGQDSGMQQAYAEHYHQLDPGVAIAARARVGHWFGDRDTLDANNPMHGEYVHDFCHPHGIGQIGGVKVLEDTSGTVFMSVQRPPGAAPYGAQGSQRMAPLFAHVHRAARLAERMAAATRGECLAEAVLDKMQAAAAVVTRTGRLVYANGAAPQVFVDTAPLRLRANHLMASDAKHAAQWSAVLGKACAPAAEGSALSLASDRSGHALQVQVVPITPRMPLALIRIEPVALVMASSARAVGHGVDVLRGLFSLTPAEARLVHALVAGQTLQDVHERTGTSVHTLKTQLAAVFAKTGTSSQVHVVALAKTLPVLHR